MAAKKKTRKKATKTKKSARKKPASAKRARKPTRTKIAKGKSTARKVATHGATAKSRRRGKSQTVDTVSFIPKGLGARSGGQSGDLQGLSNREGANSESVDELLEEGNAFEAEIVKGVEDAGDADESEVHTREHPEHLDR